MTMYEKLRKEKNKRKYERYKLMYPSHKARTGHNWKAAKDKDGNKSGLCEVCGEKRVIRAGLLE